MADAIFPSSIKSIPLFAGLTEQERDNLLSAGRTHNYSKGEHLFMHGDPLKNFYIICSGTVRLYRSTAEGNEVTTDIAISGKTMCKTEIFQAARNHTVNALAVDEVVVLEFPVSWLRDAVKNNNTLALNVISALSRYAFMVEVEAEHQATMSSTQLVACFLQRLCILHEFNPQGFELPYSKSLIASRLGMELETFSRTLPKLKENGIRVEGTRVSIYDLDAIDAYVCGNCSIMEDCPTHQTLDKMMHKKKEGLA
ncbi:MAG TPA: Crp/Fnr family transcriptional regulator [Rickettsiales bacterium]|nr:Crp/Fnr family transcriptional regulator [Rickettsiales bacterium]